MIKNQKTKNQGITLIALVITIIVLLILAGIAISMVSGNNGILTKATDAKKAQQTGEENDKDTMQLMESLITAETMPTESDVSKLNGGSGETKTGISQTTKYTDSTSQKNKTAVIPKGFYIKEGTIDTGLVVVGPDASEFVWVPVDDVNTMYGVLADGTYAGKIYSTYDKQNLTKLNWTETNGKMSITSATSRREPDPLNYIHTNGTVWANDAEHGITKESLQREYKNMIESVKIYGGFYVGRYEMSYANNIAQSKAGVQSSEADDNNQAWYGLYEKAKTYTGNGTVQSSMIWGSQYDQMMIWMKSNGKDITSTSVATHMSGNKITGVASDTDVVNNVFDLMGCHFEWTMGANNTYFRVFRGGGCVEGLSPAYRVSNIPTNTYDGYGSRLSLYIK